MNSALDVVSLVAIRDELRIPSSTDSTGAALQGELATRATSISDGLAELRARLTLTPQDDVLLTAVEESAAAVSSDLAALRVLVPLDTQTDLLTNQIEAAVSFVSHSLRGPLVDRDEKYYLPPVTGEGPLIFCSPELKSISGIKYWTPSGSLRLDPDGAIAPGDLGRLHKERYDWQTHLVYGPSAGWPETLHDSLIELTVVRGLDITPETAALRSAVILCVRQLYDGYREIRPTEAFMRITAPYRSRGYISRDGRPRGGVDL